MIIEGFSFFDAVYQTVTTITTAGVGEVEPLSDAGRAFTLVLIVAGIMVILYVLSCITQIAVEGELESILGRRRMHSRMRALKDHYILCGFGRGGEEVAREFVSRNLPFVVVETNQEAIGRAERRGYLLLIGDATNDEILKAAGVERATCLLAASDSDAGNAFIVLTARALNSCLFIVARAAYPENEKRMLRAGANRVFSPYIIAGRQMALSALHPVVVEFIDTLATRKDGAPVLAEMKVTDESGLRGRTIHDVLHTLRSVVVLGLQRPSGDLKVGPESDTVLEIGDRVIVMGQEGDLEAIRPGRS